MREYLDSIDGRMVLEFDRPATAVLTVDPMELKALTVEFLRRHRDGKVRVDGEPFLPQDLLDLWWALDLAGM